jgi:hypothetical protein
MTIDLRSGAGRWAFTLRPQANEAPGFTMELARCPPLPAAGAVELAALLGVPAGRVFVRKGEFPPFAEDCRDRTLRSVNKEV